VVEHELVDQAARGPPAEGSRDGGLREARVGERGSVGPMGATLRAAQEHGPALDSDGAGAQRGEHAFVVHDAARREKGEVAEPA
jgi:hypothetical protein